MKRPNLLLHGHENLIRKEVGQAAILVFQPPLASSAMILS